MHSVDKFSLAKRGWLASILLLLTWASFAAQTSQPSIQGETPKSSQPARPQAGSQELGPHSIQVRRATDPIKIDGRLDEPAWSEADVAAEFRMEEPNEGSPASEKTEVRVLFDEKNLYVGIHAFDSEPARINARELVRDASFSNDDKVEILLDTFHDRRNAFRFAVNPLGTQQDALITDEGRDVNLSWDAAWISDGKRDAQGWTVEIAIPLTTLRFQQGLDTWGFNAARVIRRKNEEVIWTSWQRTFGLERVSEAGELVGVGDIKRRRLIKVKPYIGGAWQEGAPRIGFPGTD